MTDTELKLALVKMLPEVVYASIVGMLFWNDTSHHVRDTELLHLASLAEAKLTPDEFYNYGHIYLPGECGFSSEFHATWQQRVTGICRTKGNE